MLDSVLTFPVRDLEREDGMLHKLMPFRPIKNAISFLTGLENSLPGTLQTVN